jgi:hypothetical protein
LQRVIDNGCMLAVGQNRRSLKGCLLSWLFQYQTAKAIWIGRLVGCQIQSVQGDEQVLD